MAPAFTAAGVTFVSAGYRLAPQHVFPAGAGGLRLGSGLGRARDRTPWRRSGPDLHRRPFGRRTLRRAAVGQRARSCAVGAAAIHGPRLPCRCRACSTSAPRRDCRCGRGFSVPTRATTSPRARSCRSKCRCRRSWSLAERTTSRIWCRRRRAFVAALRAAGAVVECVEMPERTHFTASFAGGEADGPWVPRCARVHGPARARSRVNNWRRASAEMRRQGSSRARACSPTASG